jgi:hypothetical protein
MNNDCMCGYADSDQSDICVFRTLPFPVDTWPVFAGHVPVVDPALYPATWAPGTHRLFSPYLRQLVADLLLIAVQLRTILPILPWEMWQHVIFLVMPTAHFTVTVGHALCSTFYHKPHSMPLPTVESCSFVDTRRVKLHEASLGRAWRRRQVRAEAADCAEREWRRACSDDSGDDDDTTPSTPSGMSPACQCDSPGYYVV